MLYNKCTVDDMRETRWRLDMIGRKPFLFIYKDRAAIDGELGRKKFKKMLDFLPTIVYNVYSS
jgi:hypothetical protein